METINEKAKPSNYKALIETLEEAQGLCVELNDQFEYVDDYKLIFEELNNIKKRLYRLY